MNKFRLESFDQGSILGCSSQNLVHEFKNCRELDAPNSHPSNSDLATDSSKSSLSSDLSSEGDSPEINENSNVMLKFISDMLMEEDLESKPCMLQDCFALQAAEKSFYDVIGKEYPSSSDHLLPSLNQNPENKFVETISNYSNNGYVNWDDSKITDTLFLDFPDSMNKFRLESFDQRSILGCSSQNLVHEFKNCRELDAPNSHPSNSDLATDSSKSSLSSDLSSEGDSPEINENSNVMLKFISDMLMEEDLESKPCMLQDCFALQAAEKSFYDVIGKEYPSSSDHLLPSLNQNPENKFVETISNYSNNDYVNWDDSDLASYIKNSYNESLEDTHLILDLFREKQSVGYLRKGYQEIAKSLEDTHSYTDSLLYDSTDGSKGKKNHQREGSDDPEEVRNKKHPALHAEDSEPPEIFDKVLLCQGPNKVSSSCAFDNVDERIGEREKSWISKQSRGSNGKKTRQKKQVELVDLWTLLNQCAQAVASYDHRTANQLLIQIRQHSSPYGNENQRLAHYFANGLVVRLAAGTPLYLPIASSRISAADILKAYQIYIAACPFKRMSNFFANRTILKLAEKATSLHIIDFGILYGFHWPYLIQCLSERPEGPPKLRITGIELPQPGFRPSERVEETGCRLENYCKRFNVPFECNVIAQKWETIQYEDLKIDRDDFIVVNCMYRLKNLADETVLENSPKDTVLKLIKKINPDIFIQGVVNGTYNSPYFLTRFKEALFHFSALFDMFEATVPNEDPHRLLFEKGLYGRDIMNVVACEDSKRVERPETYKQWQVRTIRAGFRQMPLDKEILKQIKSTVKSDYHKDFDTDEDGMWILQGWKGRIIKAISCWKPS